VTYFLALVLTLIVPFVGGFMFVVLVDSKIDSKANRRLHKSLSVASELIFIGSPSVILMMFGFLSLTAAIWIWLGCIALFGIALTIHNGNDVESFVMTAMMAILIPHFVISVSNAYDVYQRRHNAVETRESTANAVNP
jgi:nitrogen fixation/metabolism regulation signal transduction histidine kinase